MVFDQEDLNFIFLPGFEKEIKTYENDHSFKTFEAFLPRLLSTLNGLSSEKIRARIQ
ncbi:MAG: hypothetical protein AAF934_08270 [Bacteroidota bacterium]